MNIETKVNAGDPRTAVVVLTGEATLVAAGEVREAIVSALNESDALEIDVSGVDETDLSLYQILCSCHRQSLVSNKKITVIGGHSETFIRGACDAGFLRHTGCAADSDNTCIWCGGTN